MVRRLSRGLLHLCYPGGAALVDNLDGLCRTDGSLDGRRARSQRRFVRLVRCAGGHHSRHSQQARSRRRRRYRQRIQGFERTVRQLFLRHICLLHPPVHYAQSVAIFGRPLRRFGPREKHSGRIHSLYRRHDPGTIVTGMRPRIRPHRRTPLSAAGPHYHSVPDLHPGHDAHVLPQHRAALHHFYLRCHLHASAKESRLGGGLHPLHCVLWNDDHYLSWRLLSH
mmetsp:Transcript_4944/g.10968  ORF Transcript_4944/g.10968 Transcript_4944/m.10968 type:complete len:224 (+) Transcript_4944:1061-1732(+)